MSIHRGLVIPGLDWVVSASDGEMLDFLGMNVSCPRCGTMLHRDLDAPAPCWSDEHGHRFTNIRALVVELYQRGMLRPKGPLLIGSGRLNHSAA